MNQRAPLISLAAAIIVVSGLSVAFGGTVITNNHPANMAIINISGTQDGAENYNGDQSLWFHPFFTGGASQLLECPFPAGTYSFRVIDPADARQLFPALTTAQTNQIFTAWTYNSPWITDYLVFDSAAATNTSLPQLFDAATGPSFNSPAAAYQGALTNGNYDLIRTGPTGRDGTVFTNAYTLTNAATLIFVVPDYDLNDNGGGVSVLVSPVTQSPALNIVAANGMATLLWLSNNASGFNLEQTTNLPAASNSWSVVTSPEPSITNTNFFAVTLPLDFTTNRFFRLHHP